MRTLVFTLCAVVLLSASLSTAQGSGTDTPVIGVSPTSTYFKAAGKPVTQKITLSNKGFGSLSITGITIDGVNGGEFTETDTCSNPLGHSKRCTVKVAFSSPSTDVRTAVIHIASTDPVTPLLNVPLIANGPHLVVSRGSMSFGVVKAPKTKTAQITLTNKGNQPLTISGITIDEMTEGEFTETNTCSAPISPSKHCSLKIVFAPSSTNAETGLVTIASNDPAAAKRYVTLSGNGTKAPKLPVNTSIQAPIVSGYQTFQAGMSYPLLQVEATLPADSPLRPALRAGLQKMLGTRRSVKPALLEAAAADTALSFDSTLGLYASGFTISGNVLTDSFYTDSAGLDPAGALTVTYPQGTIITSLGDTSATPPYTMAISANITAGHLPMTGAGTIQLNDAIGAGELKGAFTLTATNVIVSADLNLSDSGNATGTAFIAENGQTVFVTDISGPFTGTLTGSVTVAPQGYTGTAHLSLFDQTFTIDLVTPTGIASGTLGPDGLTITFPNGNDETIITPLTLQPASNGTISGTVYTDTDKNGLLGGGEPGIAGVTVTLTGPDATATAMTNPKGAYSFDSLAAGSYTASSPATANGASLETDSPLSVVLTSGQNLPGENFGYITSSTTGKYTMPINLGTATPVGINDSGLIIGQSGASAGVYWSSPTDTAQDIPQFGFSGGTEFPLVLNNSGEIVGGAFDSGSGNPVWATPSSTPTLINAELMGLNDKGEIVGGAAYWVDASANATILTTLPGFTNSRAFAINSHSLIVGTSFDSGQPMQPVYWSGPTAQPAALSGPPEFYSTLVVNTNGQIVAYSPNGVEYWSSVSAQAVALPPLPGGAFAGFINGFAPGVAINDTGVVVGGCNDASANSRAVIWVDGQIQDLNSLVPSGSGWVLQYATGINGNGDIVGTGTLNGSAAAFYIAPK
ncbi:MAG TPA: choice-of-anchor D domain-containing protein [Candidatus Binatia bacterium]|jgi:probable HAF family extracellular repeat protein